MLQVFPSAPSHFSISTVPLPAPIWEKGGSSPTPALQRDLSKKAEINLTHRKS